MSDYESNELEMDDGEQEEQEEENENENENDNNEGEEQNNSNYNESNNYNNINNNSNNYNNTNTNNNKNNMNQNDTEDDQENNYLNNISSNKYQNNQTNNKNINNTKKNQYSENSNSQDNNLMKNDNNENEEIGENPEILYEEFFNYFLPAKKNTLNIKECKNAMRCLGLVVTEREIQEFLEIKEKTGKEKINLDKFKAICNKKLNETNNNYEELEQAFEMLDPEKTGIVNSMVLRHQMKIFKPKITDEEINQILSEFGEDKNGNINYREYLNNLKS